MERTTCLIPKAAACACLMALLVGCASPLERGVDAYDNRQYGEAARYWEPLAVGGDAYAQNNLGVLYERGLGGLPKDYDQAAYWYRASAQQGYVPAMVQLARVLSLAGANDEADRWLNEAGRWGDRSAVATLQKSGKPVPPPDLQRKHQRLNALAAD